MADKTPTIWYHGTSTKAWKKIQKDGSLLGNHPDGKYTYLSLEEEDAEAYGEVLLEVIYDPTKDFDENNYFPDCLELRVAAPIETLNIKRIK